jgi:hypothetical protein
MFNPIFIALRLLLIAPFIDRFANLVSEDNLKNG